MLLAGSVVCVIKNETVKTQTNGIHTERLKNEKKNDKAGKR
jgi:hypothetical protein